MAVPASCVVFDPALAVLAGTHRVQRVPASEKKGRRQTSTVTVVALDDTRAVTPVSPTIRIDTYRASGPGGQHRNTTDSAVRAVDTATGTTATATESRSQHVNREVALERLHARLAARQVDDEGARRNDHRREAVDDQRRTWMWVEWRDRVKGPDGVQGSMRRVLRGGVGVLLR